MALVIANRVKDSTTTTGTGTITLSGTAPAGYQNFSVIGNANTTYYCIAGQTGSEWEVGVGTYTSSGTTLARTTVLSNSSATQPSALSFSAGTKDVFVTYPAEYSVDTVATQTLTNKTLTAPVIATITNTGTLTLPTATGTFITTTGGVTPGTTGNVLVSNGTSWTSAAATASSPISTPDVKTTGTSATFTIPAGVTKMKITVQGGGGNGGTGGSYSQGAGGGAGGYALSYLTGLTAGNTITYTVGGIGGTSSISSGTQTITTVTCTGGATGGTGTMSTSPSGGAGGSATNGLINTDGSRGADNGGGGVSPFAGSGEIRSATAGAGFSATGFGSGGGAGVAPYGGGSGKAGVIIFEY